MQVGLKVTRSIYEGRRCAHGAWWCVVCLWCMVRPCWCVMVVVVVMVVVLARGLRAVAKQQN